MAIDPARSRHGFVTAGVRSLTPGRTPEVGARIAGLLTRRAGREQRVGRGYRRNPSNTGRSPTMAARLWKPPRPLSSVGRALPW